MRDGIRAWGRGFAGRPAGFPGGEQCFDGREDLLDFRPFLGDFGRNCAGVPEQGGKELGAASSDKGQEISYHM